MAVDIISWPISTKECSRTRGSNPQPSACQVDTHPTELPGPQTKRSHNLCIRVGRPYRLRSPKTRWSSSVFIRATPFFFTNSFLFVHLLIVGFELLWMIRRRHCNVCRPHSLPTALPRHPQKGCSYNACSSAHSNESSLPLLLQC